jgi:hypothetical protein
VAGDIGVALAHVENEKLGIVRIHPGFQLIE